MLGGGTIGTPCTPLAMHTVVTVLHTDLRHAFLTAREIFHPTGATCGTRLGPLEQPWPSRKRSCLRSSLLRTHKATHIAQSTDLPVSSTPQWCTVAIARTATMTEAQHLPWHMKFVVVPQWLKGAMAHTTTTLIALNPKWMGAKCPR